MAHDPLPERPRRVPAGFTAAERPAPAWTAGTFEWTQAGPWWRPHWEIRVQGELLATFERVGWAGRSQMAETTGARWHLRPRGLLGGPEVFREGEETPTLVFHGGWLGHGRIERRSGPPWRWRRRRFGWIGRSAGGRAWGIHHLWTVEDHEGAELVRVRMRRGFLEDTGALEITDAGLERPDLEPLLMLAWRLALSVPRHTAHG